MRITWDLPGGIHPPENKEQSLLEPLAEAPVPSELVFPLSQHLGAPAKPVVAVGDNVLKGQVIAEAEGFVSAPVHASSSGTVIAIENRIIPHPSGMTGPCIVIKTDGRNQWTELDPLKGRHFSELENQEILERIHKAGIAGMGGAGFPARVKLSPPPDAKIDTLIINGTECEPYITADDMLMRTRSKSIVNGVRILSQLLGEPKNVLIGIEDNKPEAIKTMQQTIKDEDVEDRLEVVTFPTKYPSGGEKQLIWILTGREVPSGGLPAHIGVVVQNIGSTEAIYRAVVEGRPLISRLTTVTGEGVNRPRNYEVLLGTPVQELLELSEAKGEPARLIIGGPMMGYSVETASIPVVKTTNCVLAPANQELPAEEPANPCIRCGMCANACPVTLLPQQMYWHAQAQDYDKLQAHNLMDCIECGCCSYVCPSNLPLVQSYRAAKGEIRTIQAEKQKSDLARERFEARKERIEKEQQAKEAKQAARKKAAAERKATGSTSTDPVEAAVRSAESSNDTASADQQRKLEKSVESLRKRLKKAEEKAAEGAGTEQESSLLAKAEEAKLKLSLAEQKLAEVSGQNPEESSAAENIVDQQIAKAETLRGSRTDRERVESTVAHLEEKLMSLAGELHRARENGHEGIDSLQQRVTTWEKKLEDAQEELHTLDKEPEAEGGGTEDRASQAIEKAKAKAAELADMDPREKLANKIESISKRLEKARARCDQAREDNDENLEAFETSVSKLTDSLHQAEKELEGMDR
jgi:electron transport complex protein RnfC